MISCNLPVETSNQKCEALFGYGLANMDFQGDSLERHLMQTPPEEVPETQKCISLRPKIHLVQAPPKETPEMHFAFPMFAFAPGLPPKEASKSEA